MNELMEDTNKPVVPLGRKAVSILNKLPEKVRNSIHEMNLLINLKVVS